MSSRLLLLPFVLAVALAPAPAAAGTSDNPELTDPCGPGADVEDPGPNTPTPWADICAGWLTSLTVEDGPPVLQIALRMADAIEERPTSAAYRVFLTAGDGCAYTVHRDDEQGAELVHRCGPPVTERPCDPDLVVLDCSTPTESTVVPLPAESFAEDGDTLTVTLEFVGALSPFAHAFVAGSVISGLGAYTYGATNLQAGTVCYGVSCTSTFGDRATGGSDYVMPVPGTQ